MDIKEFTSMKEFKEFLIKKFMNTTKREINWLKKYNQSVKDSYLHPKFQEISKL